MLSVESKARLVDDMHAATKTFIIPDNNEIIIKQLLNSVFVHSVVIKLLRQTTIFSHKKFQLSKKQ